ncbi:hypothetical protein [Apilactobacillus apinorum]|uniref:hypothetical protein n=1 Tax=Apilactobacillus apinorum TaxID=1218495 RepID=UPI000A8FD596|nr:hypothetical protein [Apilactobacillus apinorum]CAI2693625.1 hypothetical protein AAPFHON13_13450 [Apilactobacillus apinorum]
MLDVELMSGLILFLVGILSFFTFLAIIVRRIYLKSPIQMDIICFVVSSIVIIISYFLDSHFILFILSSI